MTLTGLTLAPAATADPAPVPSGITTARSCVQSRHQAAMACNAVRVTGGFDTLAHSTGAVDPGATPSGYGPDDLRSAYALPSSGGDGRTVAVVDAYDDPNAESDLATYR